MTGRIMTIAPWGDGWRAERRRQMSEHPTRPPSAELSFADEIAEAHHDIGARYLTISPSAQGEIIALAALAMLAEAGHDDDTIALVFLRGLQSVRRVRVVAGLAGELFPDVEPCGECPACLAQKESKTGEPS
jgi:hypothetical protein